MTTEVRLEGAGWRIKSGPTGKLEWKGPAWDKLSDKDKRQITAELLRDADGRALLPRLRGD